MCQSIIPARYFCSSLQEVFVCLAQMSRLKESPVDKKKKQKQTSERDLVAERFSQIEDAMQYSTYFSIAISKKRP